MQKITMLPAERIQLPDDRQRRQFTPEAMQALRESLSTAPGLMHPIVVRGSRELPTLVAGERRTLTLFSIWLDNQTAFFAGEPLPPFTLPVVHMGDLSELEAFEAELVENVRREGLTWQEEADAVGRLHELREAQAAQRNAVHTVADTVKEITGSVRNGAAATIRDKLVLAQHLSIPEVAKAKTAKDAMRIIVQRDRKEHFAKLSAEVGQTFSASKHTLLHGDCVELIPTLGTDRFDVLLLDPPFGIDADKIMTSAGDRQIDSHDYADTYEVFQRVLRPDLWYAACKPEAHVYVFCDIDRFHEVRERMEAAGFWTHRTPLIYFKPDAQRVPWTEHGPRRCSEYVCYGIKGKRRTNFIGPDVFTARQDSDTGHGAGKPVGCYRELLARSARPGDTVADFFMGSGSSLIASHEAQCTYTGIELLPHWYGVSVARSQGLL